MRFPRDRGRLVAVLSSVACVVAVVLGATVATSTLAPAVAFAQTGHWVVNSAESAVVHVDGGTRQVDARVELPSDVGDPLFALQGERQGFVVAADRIAVFGRSSLTVDSTIPVEFAEVPVGIETLGGPYLVYREAGTIVRLGVPPLSLPVGGRLDRPVWTDDGTVWLHRPDNGSFCALRNGAAALDCSAGAAPGELGGLSIAGELPAFVGTRQDAAQVIAARLGAPVGLGADVVDAALLADRDTSGRLAVVDPATNRLVLTDSSGVPDGRDGGAPVVVELGPGTFTSPVAADGIVALLDTAADRLLTYDVTGRLIAALDLPPGTDAADLIRGGDGRIYVDDADGSATHIVGSDGAVTSVGTGGGSSNLITVAAPPSRLSPVVPPPSGAGSMPNFSSVGNTGRPSSGAPIDRNPTSPGGGSRPVGEPPLSTPAVPTAVIARVDGTSIVVSWQAVTGATSYIVTAPGLSGQTVTAPTVMFANVPRGQRFVFTVRAMNAAGTGPPSASNEVGLAAAPPGAPSGLAVSQAGGGIRQVDFDVNWQAPELNGGELIGYVVTMRDTDGVEAFTETTSSTSAQTTETDCLAPYVTTVYAQTRDPETGGVFDGQSVSVSTTVDVECRTFVQLSAVPVSPTSIRVDVDTSGAGHWGAACELTLNGSIVWTGDYGACSVDGAPSDFSIPVADLEPGTSYTAQMTTNSRGGHTSASNAVTVQTAADDTCVAEDPRPPGCP